MSLDQMTKTTTSNSEDPKLLSYKASKIELHKPCKTYDYRSHRLTLQCRFGIGDMVSFLPVQFFSLWGCYYRFLWTLRQLCHRSQTLKSEQHHKSDLDARLACNDNKTQCCIHDVHKGFWGSWHNQ